MFALLGKFVARAWPVFLAGWVLFLIAMARIAPPWDEVAESGQFSFLPKQAPSIRGKELLKDAFPDEVFASNIVIVLSRDDERPIYADRDFIEHDLRDNLKHLADEQESPIARIQTLNDEGSGALLVNPYQNATLVVINLTLEFLDRRAWPIVHAVEDLIERLHQENQVPEGLDVAVTGSAVVGRDMRQAELKSAHTIQTWTVWLVIGLLLLIYRAPLLALIPVLTVFCAIQSAINVVALMAQHGLIALSETNRIYISVLGYGAGVDYCLFLIARYREELEHGGNMRDALVQAIGKVGGTITASAATVICGIAMLALAQFGKYYQAAISIPLSLCFVLLSALTFSPSLLRLTGRWAFWPFGITPGTQLGRLDRFLGSTMFAKIWEKTGAALQRRPATIWVVCLLIMIPFAGWGVRNYQNLDYGLASDVAKGAPSLLGTERLSEHFPSGFTGPITVLIRNDEVDFTSAQGSRLIEALASRLEKEKDDLKIQDIRSVAQPLGISPIAKDIKTRLERLSNPDLYKSMRQKALSYYVSDAAEHRSHVTRLEIVSNLDPLSQRSIENLRRIEDVVRSELPRELADSQIEFVGSTASLRDVQVVTTNDLRRIEVAVPAVIFVILVIILRQIIVSIYLVASVLFSYLATLGVTFAVFWMMNPQDFSGLDWKLPIFLFTILVAVGEDYNIFLMTRVKEEQETHGPIQGVSEAVIKTGGIISSCGFIMAGTFASLMFGTLAEMKQLGFALAFGVLVDTLVVRPLLVPSFLILLQRKQLTPDEKAKKTREVMARP